MKKIAITQRLIENDSYYEVREALDIQWGKLLEELGFLPVILPINFNLDVYMETLGVEGVILTGGNDLNQLNPSALSEMRDTYEKKLIAYCLKKNIPVFGVCRGMQILGNYFELPLVKVANQAAIRHPLVVSQSSALVKELLQIKDVNSFHNYAVSSLTEDWILSAKSDSNIIKAMEHKKHNIFAQMWHPERETPFSSPQMKVIKSFFS